MAGPTNPYEGMLGGSYARKSSYQGKKRRKGESVREQLGANEKEAARLGVTIAEEFIDDDRSASRHGANAEREDFERMIEWIESGKIHIAFAWASTRLQRDLAVYVRLRDACAKHGVLWCYGGKVYDLSNKDDRFRTAIDAVIGEREVDELRDNVMRSLEANAAAGKPHGKNVYGYRRIYDPFTGAFVRVEKIPAEAAIVREISDRVAAGEAYTRIARDLNMRGVLPPAPEWTWQQVNRLAEWRPGLPKDGELHPATIQRIKDHRHLQEEAQRRLADGEKPLDISRDFNERGERRIMCRWVAPTIVEFARQTRYLGTRTRNGDVTAEKAWPRIVKASTHARCLLIIRARKDSRKWNTRPGAAKNWLSGAMKCDVCEILTGSDKRDSGPRYCCVQPGTDDAKGYHVSAETGPVDEFVLGKLLDWLADPKFVAAFTQDDKKVLAEIEEAEASVALLTSELEEFYVEAGAGRLSARALSSVEADYLPKINEAKERAHALRAPSVLQGIAGASRADLEVAWPQLKLEQQRLIAQTLLDIRLKPRGNSGKHLDVSEYVTVRPLKLVA
ncbi:recombinase family protein [Kitasatospora sp. NBC_00070]|uniref:recombinase family protein n=1 Tax=Kitasatospora sp. NBC_00070 TaxID=2975962 RepID=UPI003255FD75